MMRLPNSTVTRCKSKFKIQHKWTSQWSRFFTLLAVRVVSLNLMSLTARIVIRAAHMRWFGTTIPCECPFHWSAWVYMLSLPSSRSLSLCLYLPLSLSLSPSSSCLSITLFIPPSPWLAIMVAAFQQCSCQSICIVALCCHCGARQRPPVCGITQLDGGGRQGHVGPPGCTKKLNLALGLPTLPWPSVCVCVQVCALAHVCVSRGPASSKPNPKFIVDSFLLALQLQWELVINLNSTIAGYHFGYSPFSHLCHCRGSKSFHIWYLLKSTITWVKVLI